MASAGSERGATLGSVEATSGTAATQVALVAPEMATLQVTDRFIASTTSEALGVSGASGLSAARTGSGTGLVLGMEPKPLPDIGGSVVRMVGGLALVLALFFGGLWVVRNGRRLGMVRGNLPDLRLLECRSLGGRQSVWVMSYQRQRFLVASGPTGVTLLSVLPEAEDGVGEAVAGVAGVADGGGVAPAVGGGGSGRKLVMADFMGALRQALGRSAGGGR
jgi:hypothetical protein